MTALYLLILAGTIACMALLDRRFGLFFWRDARRASLVLGLGVAFFVLWDIAGIALGIFLRGQNEISTGIMLGPEFPLEELLFLVFLCYLTMVVFNGARLLLDRRVRVDDTARVGKGAR
ncbi:lycopene cyclase domain-containing protein [Microterricola gilva]|uniref:Lycopene cyclase domain-containing protein n=1 Tax=Microterricola gilva TaxID=393267 RepID=A0A4V2GB60_9MICO|nr:lycopene cyclase domain-containing protein [Microterricola gilva]RZU66896.1 lycopene cyclase domain-containing protein [Microterricola gilva]